MAIVQNDFLLNDANMKQGSHKIWQGAMEKPGWETVGKYQERYVLGIQGRNGDKSRLRQVRVKGTRSEGTGVFLRYAMIEFRKKLCYIIAWIMLFYQSMYEVLRALKNNIEVDVKNKM